MNWFSTIIVTVNILSIAFLVLTLQRAGDYIRKMVLPESKYTLLFKFLEKEFPIYGYVLVVTVNTAISLYIAFFV